MRPLLVLALLLSAVALLLWLVLPRSSGRRAAELDYAPDTAANAGELAALDEHTAVESVLGSEPSARAEVTARDVVPSFTALAGTGFRGRLVEHDGAPVADLAVELLQASPEPISTRAGLCLFRVGWTRTGADGGFTLLGADPDALHLLTVDPGGSRGAARAVERRARPTELVDLGDVVLERAAELCGRVTSSTGEPVEGARVRACAHAAYLPVLHLVRGSTRVLTSWGSGAELQAPPAELLRLIDRAPVPTTYTDADGRFRLRAPLGRTGLVVDHADFPGKVEGPFDLASAGRELPELRLPEERTVSGRVLDAAGRPVAGAEVFVGVNLYYGSLLEPAGRTDRAGRFRAPVLIGAQELTAGAAPALLVAARAGEGAWTVDRDVTPEAEVRLAPQRSITVAVTDEARRPVDWARVEVEAWGQEDFLCEPVKRSALPIGPGLYAAKGLARGTYVVSAVAKGLTSASTTLWEPEDLAELGELEEPEEAEGPESPAGSERDQVPASSMTSEATDVATVDLVLAPERALEIEVVSADGGGPVAGARVRFVLPTLSFVSENEQEEVAVALTDAAGRARLAGLPVDPAQGSFSAPRLRVEHPSFPPIAVPVSSEQRCVVTLLTPGAIEGRVLEEGGPPERRYFLWLEPLDGGRTAPIFDLTEPDGTFRIERLGPGPYVVSVAERFLQGDPLRFLGKLIPEFELEPEWIASRITTVAAGETARLELDLRSDGVLSTISGRVTFDGRSVSGARIRVLYGHGFDGTSDADGYYRIADVPPGKHNVRVTAALPELGRTPVELWKRELALRGGDMGLDLELSRFEVEVLVADHTTGEPVRAGVVHARLAGEPDSDVRGELDSRGRARLAPWREGEYRVWLESTGYAAEAVEAELSARLAPVLLRIEARRAVPVRGRVDISGVEHGKDGAITLRFERVDRELGSSVVLQPGNLHFEAAGLLPGDYRVECRLGVRRLSTLEISVGPAGATDIVLSFVAR